MLMPLKRGGGDVVAAGQVVVTLSFLLSLVTVAPAGGQRNPDVDGGWIRTLRERPPPPPPPSANWEGRSPYGSVRGDGGVPGLHLDDEEGEDFSEVRRRGSKKTPKELEEEADDEQSPPLPPRRKRRRERWYSSEEDRRAPDHFDGRPFATFDHDDDGDDGERYREIRDHFQIPNPLPPSRSRFHGDGNNERRPMGSFDDEDEEEGSYEGRTLVGLLKEGKSGPEMRGTGRRRPQPFSGEGGPRMRRPNLGAGGRLRPQGPKAEDEDVGVGVGSVGSNERGRRRRRPAFQEEMRRPFFHGEGFPPRRRPQHQQQEFRHVDEDEEEEGEEVPGHADFGGGNRGRPPYPFHRLRHQPADPAQPPYDIDDLPPPPGGRPGFGGPPPRRPLPSSPVGGGGGGERRPPVFGNEEGRGRRRPPPNKEYDDDRGPPPPLFGDGPHSFPPPPPPRPGGDEYGPPGFEKNRLRNHQPPRDGGGGPGGSSLSYFNNPRPEEGEEGPQHFRHFDDEGTIYRRPQFGPEESGGRPGQFRGPGKRPGDFRGLGEPGGFRESGETGRFRGPGERPGGFRGPGRPEEFRGPGRPEEFRRPGRPEEFKGPEDFRGPGRPEEFRGPGRPGEPREPGGRPGDFRRPGETPEGLEGFRKPGGPGGFRGPGRPGIPGRPGRFGIGNGLGPPQGQRQKQHQHPHEFGILEEEDAFPSYYDDFGEDYEEELIPIEIADGEEGRELYEEDGVVLLAAPEEEVEEEGEFAVLDYEDVGEEGRRPFRGREESRRQPPRPQGLPGNGLRRPHSEEGRDGGRKKPLPPPWRPAPQGGGRFRKHPPPRQQQQQPDLDINAGLPLGYHHQSSKEEEIFPSSGRRPGGSGGPGGAGPRFPGSDELERGFKPFFKPSRPYGVVSEGEEAEEESGRPAHKLFTGGGDDDGDSRLNAGPVVGMGPMRTRRRKRPPPRPTTEFNDADNGGGDTFRPPRVEYFPEAEDYDDDARLSYERRRPAMFASNPFADEERSGGGGDGGDGEEGFFTMPESFPSLATLGAGFESMKIRSKRSAEAAREPGDLRDLRGRRGRARRQLRRQLRKQQLLRGQHRRQGDFGFHQDYWDEDDNDSDHVDEVELFEEEEEEGFGKRSHLRRGFNKNLRSNRQQQLLLRQQLYLEQLQRHRQLHKQVSQQQPPKSRGLLARHQLHQLQQQLQQQRHQGRRHRDPHPEQSIQVYPPPPYAGDLGHARLLSYSEKARDNEILGSGNFEVIKGGTFYDADTFYRYKARPQEYYDADGEVEEEDGEGDFFENFRDFADIKNDLYRNRHNAGGYYN